MTPCLPRILWSIYINIYIWKCCFSSHLTLVRTQTRCCRLCGEKAVASDSVDSVTLYCYFVVFLVLRTSISQVFFFLTWLCNKYWLKTKKKERRGVISPDKRGIQQLFNFSLLTRASTRLGTEFGVIFPHYFSSSSAGDAAPPEYPIWLLLLYGKMNCLWRKITPLCRICKRPLFSFLYFSLGFFSAPSGGLESQPAGLNTMADCKALVHYVFDFFFPLHVL